MLEDSAAPGTFAHRDLSRYRASWREGSLTAMLDYYRAVARYRDDPPRTEVAAPTLICWGEQDVALVPEMAERSRQLCADGRLERFPEASHWVHVEESDRVTAALRAHLP
nr:alpha/beta hydrolase [Halapricum sp. CBA1109]